MAEQPGQGLGSKDRLHSPILLSQGGEQPQDNPAQSSPLLLHTQEILTVSDLH